MLRPRASGDVLHAWRGPMRISSFGFLVAIVITVACTAGCKPLASVSCTTNTDCPSGLCVGGTCRGRTTYDNCSSTSDCDSFNDTCTLVMSSGSNRFCSRACSVGTDCPNSLDGTAFGVCLP